MLYRFRIRRAINRHRSDHDLVPVRFDRRANAAARAWARTLQREDAFAHNDMLAVAEACDASYAGEILGRGDISPRGFGRLWMASPPHRQVMLNPIYRRVGVGAVRTKYGRLVVVNFIRR